MRNGYVVRGGSPVLVRSADGGHDDWQWETLDKVTYFPVESCVLTPDSPNRRNRDSYTFLENGKLIDVKEQFIYAKPMNELRQIIRNALVEKLSLRRDGEQGDTWTVTASMLRGFGDFAGFDSRKEGYNKLSVFAPIIARKSFENDTVRDGRAPHNAVPKDVLIALKTERPHTNKDGVTLVPEQGLIDALVASTAKKVADRYRGKPIDVVTSVQSSSRLANAFAKAVADLLGVKFMPNGLLKQTDPEQLRLDFSVSPGWEEKMDDVQRKRYADALARMKRKMKDGLSASLRSHFIPQDRKFVRGMLVTNPDMLDHVDPSGAAPKVLVCDDVITSGATTEMAARELQDYGFEIAGLTAIFKMEDTR